MSTDQLSRILQENWKILEHHGVKSIAVFGSVARGEAREDSDIDLLVEFIPGTEPGLFEFIELRDSLSRLLEASVDLATPDALHPALRDSIIREAVHVA